MSAHRADPAPPLTDAAASPAVFRRLALGLRLVDGALLLTLVVLPAGLLAAGVLRAQADAEPREPAPDWAPLLSEALPALLLCAAAVALAGALTLVFAERRALPQRILWCLLLLVPWLNLVVLAVLVRLARTRVRTSGAPQ